MTPIALATRSSSPQQSASPAPATAGAQDLLAQNQALTEQLAGLQAQRQVLLGQAASGQKAIRQAAFDRLPGVETQIAQVSVDLASVRARVASRRSSQGVRELMEVQPNTPPTYAPRSRGNNGDAVGMVAAFSLMVLLPISIAFARRIWVRGAAPSPQPILDVVTPRLDRMEQAIDAIAIEVERISEGQRFVTRVLAERPAVPEDAQAFRALGAGPIEPVRVAERQAVRQSITPH
jgi:hypothetical protein